MLDILSSPLKSYLAQTLQYYLSKYLKDIHLEGFGFFGSDLVLNDLEIKRHVLQTALDIPSSFDFSRGFIRELRIHIPWTQILSQPIEIKLYTVELILTSKDEQPSTPPMDGNDQQSQIEPPKSTWLQSMLSKILANISIQVNNLVLKYEQEDIVLSVTLGVRPPFRVDYTCAICLTSLEEPHVDVCPRMDANDISIFLDRYTSDRLSVDVDSDIIHRQVIGYEVPVLRRTSFGVRVQYALEPTLFGVVPSTPKATYMPSRFTDPFSGHRLHGRPTFLLMDVYINELNLSLSDRQVQMLVHVATTTPPPTPSSSPSKPPAKPSPLHRAHSTPLPPPPLSLDHHNLARPLVSEPTNISPPTTTTTTSTTTSSWSTWAMDMLVGAPPDDLEAELLQGIQATNIYQSNPRMPTTSTTPFPQSLEGDEYYTATSRDNQDDMSAALLPSSLSPHLLTVRVSIQHISLTLRCHAHTTAADDDGVDTAATIISTPDQAAFSFASPYPPDKQHEYAVEYVPVANMGLVQVASYSPLHTKTKVSKAADPIAVFTVTGTLVAWSTDQTHVKELEVDIENVVGMHHHHHIMQPKPQQPPPLSIPLDAKHRSTSPALTTEFIRMGTFHSSNQRSIAHANITQSLFAPDLQNQTTWNPQLERFRHLQWDPSTQVHCYQYIPPPPPVSGDALTSPEVSTSNTFLLKCTCNVGTEHSVSSIQSFWADSLPTLCQAAAAASKLLSRHECTAAAISLTDEIARRLHAQYTVPSSHKTSTILLQDLVEHTFENAINLTQGSSTRRKSKTDTAGITSSLPQDDPSMAAMLFNMLVPALVVYSAQLVGHTCRSRATPSAIRIHMVEDISPPLMDPPMSKAVADVSVGVVEVIVTVPVLIAAVDFVQRIELPKASK
ncbi:hypothetical protein DYB26_004615 [Aphanomyces astaci]|uniref:Uncharacterized protein n=2 Tax=Aphanomyces astaci TaxID=112090 RepID=A0A418FU13_APHAT|nr:hypothetical protein DYB26_004615 [Aphanomyces astaci]